MITNLEILKYDDHQDAFCLSARMISHDSNGLVIQVREEDPAIAIMNPKAAPFDVDSVRKGALKDIWLLSSGFLIFDQHHRLALGKRNRRAADPDLWTNIAAGRCSDKIMNHAREELVEEFFYIGELPDSPSTTVRVLPAEFRHHPLLNIQLLAVEDRYSEIVYSPGQTVTPESILGYPLQEWQSITIHWPDGTEEIEGLVFIDYDNRTVEIRFLYLLEIPELLDGTLLFYEGDLVADWFPIDLMLYFRFREKKDGTRFYVPFMQFFLDIISKNNLHLHHQHHII